MSNLEIFYQNLSQKIDSIDKIYSNISCKTACNRCCKFYGSPEVFDFEWENIIYFLEKKFTEKEINRIKRKLDISDDENLSECPFIYKNLCSIYEVRPLICRMFGYTLNSGKIMTCSEELNKWDFIEDKSDLLNKEDIDLELIEKFQLAEFNYKSILEWLKKFFENKKAT